MKNYIKATLLTLGAVGLLLPMTGHAFSMGKQKEKFADHVGTLPDGPKIILNK